MKRTIFLLLTIALMCLGEVQAQNPDYPIGISFRALLMDYQSQNGGSFSSFRQYDTGFEIGVRKKMNDNISLVVPLRFGIVTSHDSINDLGENVVVRDRRRFHKIVAGIDAQVHYQFYKPTYKVIPYLIAGIGAVYESEGEFNLQAPIGLGFNFKVADNMFINLQSEYRYSFSESRNNLHHGLGFVYLFGGKEVAKKEEMMKDDSDGDGIIDDLDLCPNAAGPKELNGCPDRDGDGIADFQDVCPDIAGLKDFRGCPDSDNDGISDNDDECPNLAGIASNNGCPGNDRDQDGVEDSKDRCPDLPGDRPDGCPSNDNDLDGVPNDVDRCPEDAGSVAAEGCPDADGDGVADFEDKCPTSPGSKVYGGCPDSDGDGIDDSRDRCPNSAGPVSTGGCPEISRADREVLELAMRAVQFDTGKAILKSESFDILTQIAAILKRYPDYNLSVSGHTDNTGSATANQSLSERRAKACYDFLASQGIPKSRMNYAGYGESRPISDNNTLRGRALNRRVEFNMIPR
jgi:outer membrane protein OmpA-like peptidoglycan-associated protein